MTISRQWDTGRRSYVLVCPTVPLDRPHPQARYATKLDVDPRADAERNRNALPTFALDASSGRLNPLPDDRRMLLSRTPATVVLRGAAVAALGLLAAGVYAETIRVPDQP